MKRTTAVAALAGAAVFSSLAGAQSAGTPAGGAYSFAERPFEALDADRNGFLIRQEVIGALPGLADGFDLADRSGDRLLNRPEYEHAMAVGATLYGDDARAARKRELFRALDLDADRMLSRAEFARLPLAGLEAADAAAGATAASRPLDENPAVPGRTHERFSFAELDLNNDGRIARTEAALREGLLRDFWHTDANGDGSVSRSEFQAWRRRQ